MKVFGLDVGSNSVGSAWIDLETGEIRAGVSVFPAGVDESDDKRGEPKNAKRRATRRTRITLARRAERKRALRARLIGAGLLPASEEEFGALLEATDPWELRRRGLDDALTPYKFGRVLLHLAQRRGALGLNIPDAEEDEGDEGGEIAAKKEDGKVKAAIGAVRAEMLARKARTFGEFMAMVRGERVTEITTEDKRPEGKRIGAREFRGPVRNKAAAYERCADRDMIRAEFTLLWDTQRRFGGETARLLTDDLRGALDNEHGDDRWRHKGDLFGQRRQSWDLGTLGRCPLHPSERCAPHADRFASRFLVVETVNNLRIVERGKAPRPLTPEERRKILDFLSGPLGVETPKRTVSVTDLRNFMGTTKEGWGKAPENSRFRSNIESDEERGINTDWFSREIVHGAVGVEAWAAMDEETRERVNRFVLKFDPDEKDDAEKLRERAAKWCGLDQDRADRLVSAWRTRPRPDAKRLSSGRSAARNALAVMDRPEPWPDGDSPTGYRWLTQVEARRAIAGDADYMDVTTGRPLDDVTRRRYATGAKGATARDRHYLKKHTLRKDGKPIVGPDGKALSEPPPAPMVTNPVVRKAIHEVRRHVVEHMIEAGARPDQVYVELAREARMGKMESDRVLFRNRLRNRIRNEILREFGLESAPRSRQDAAVARVVLCEQQGGVCPLCANQLVKTAITARMAATGENCEVAHIVPRGKGGENGFGNMVLSHTRCNREMGRRTPREYWGAVLPGGFDEGMDRVEKIFGDIKRISPAQAKSATGEELWKCYFAGRPGRFGPTYDERKIEQFRREVKDIQDMTARQEAATKQASRQLMAYLADALFEGKGLPERSAGQGESARLVFATDGMWTSRLRREWGLFYDPHGRREKGIEGAEAQERKEKDRGDHRHHAIDAIVIALCSRSVQIEWEKREKAAEDELSNPGDDEAMEGYRRRHPIRPPAPFDRPEMPVDEAIKTFRKRVELAVYGPREGARPVAHRPVKRKLIGALHEETLFGPVLSAKGELTGNYTAKKSTAALEPNHLRLPEPETAKQAEARLAERRERTGVSAKDARKWARAAVSSPGFKPREVDPPPGKSGIVRDEALRRRLRVCLEEAGLDPDGFSKGEMKKFVESGGFAHESGVPIRSVVLLRTMSDPVVIARRRPDHATGRMVMDDDPASLRAYVGGNNHHIEIREDARGKWSGDMVTAYEAARRKLAGLRAAREAGVPRGLGRLPPRERARHADALRAASAANPIVDRRDDEARGGRFVMSLCEGETLYMKHKKTGEPGYFVVAKLDKPQSAVVVPHWDARAATLRKDAEGNKVEGSEREQFAVTPADLMSLAPPGHDHAVKVRVSPLGVVKVIERD